MMWSVGVIGGGADQRWGYVARERIEVGNEERVWRV